MMLLQVVCMIVHDSNASCALGNACSFRTVPVLGLQQCQVLMLKPEYGMSC